MSFLKERDPDHSVTGNGGNQPDLTRSRLGHDELLTNESALAKEADEQILRRLGLLDERAHGFFRSADRCRQTQSHPGCLNGRQHGTDFHAFWGRDAQPVRFTRPGP